MRDDVAGILALAAVGAVSSGEVATWVDSELLASDAPPSWLLDASLALSPEDRLHHLREVAQPEETGVPRLCAALLAYDRGRLNAKELAHLGLGLLYDGLELPGALGDAVSELDEEACCAHMFNGEPQPERVAAAVQVLRVALTGAGPHYVAFQRLQERCSTLMTKDQRL